MIDITKTTPEKAYGIDWRESFLSYPFIVLYTEPSNYRLAIKRLSDDGKTMQILPSLEHDINSTLQVLNELLQQESNLPQQLEEHFGKIVYKLSQIHFDFNGIEVVDKKTTITETKLKWLKDGLKKGYKNLVKQMTQDEIEYLEKDPEVGPLIEKYRWEI